MVTEEVQAETTAFTLARERFEGELADALSVSQRVISADSHIIEPGDLWTSRIDAEYRERGPHIEMQGTLPDGTVEEGQFMVVEGGTPQRVAGFAVANVDPKDRAEANKRGYEQIRPGAWDPVERLKDQDIDGIVSEVIYPSMAMPYFSLPDTGLQQAVFRAYNDWIAEFCSHAPQRLVGLGMICTDDVDEACAELHRARSLGLRGALIPNSLAPEGSYGDPAFDPLWATAAELDMPLSMHILTGRYRPSGAAADPWLVWYMDLPAPAMKSITAMLCSGVFSRHPNLKVVSVENDIGWLGHFLYRLQHGWDEFRYMLNLEQDLSPNEYFERNIWATFQSDPVGVQTRERIGINRLMWGSDYPHGDSTWPESRPTINFNFQGVEQDDIAAICYDTVAELYGIEL
jgi:predicted TIM-barrel fold metal-dependent hydrolase